VPGLSNVKDLVSGGNHACALLEDGVVQCWGANEAGQIGDGSKQDRPQPTPAEGLTGVGRLWAGGSVSLAQVSNTFRGWGLSTAGGDAVIDSSLPAPYLTLGTAAAEGVAVAVNSTSGCVAGKNKPTRCWGLRPSDVTDVRW
jgi:hypothetical protein